jgi:hypothetical protein
MTTDIDEFGLLVREGHYNPAAPRERSVRVVVTVPDLGPVMLLLPLDATCTLLVDGATPWPVLARRALDVHTALGGAPRADLLLLAAWLAVDTHWDAYTTAWAQHRARSLRRRAKRTYVLLGEHCRRWGIPEPDTTQGLEGHGMVRVSEPIINPDTCADSIKGLGPDTDGETTAMTMIMEQRSNPTNAATASAEPATEQFGVANVSQDAVGLNRCYDGLDGGLMSQMSHEAFAERIVTGITNPAQLAGEVCLNCAKPADRDMAPAGWAETGERVYVHRGECYMRLKWWAEAPIRRARREAAPGIVQGLTDEAIRLVLEQVIAAGVRSRRSEMDTDLAHAETAAERARAAELPLPPCPSWCAGASDLDSWGWDGEEFRRIHERTLYKSTPPEDESGLGARLVVLQYERWQDGAPVLEPAMVDVTVETGDPATVRAMTSALNEAATMLEKLAAG